MKRIILSITVVFTSCLGLYVYNPIILNDNHFVILQNIEALAKDEFWSKDKFTKTESYTQTRINDEQEHYYEKHTIECEPGGIVPDCTPVCETREVSFGKATPWKPCSSSNDNL